MIKKLLFISLIMLLLPLQAENIPVGVTIGNKAPDFTIKDIDGKQFSLSACKDKIVYMVFWTQG